MDAFAALPTRSASDVTTHAVAFAQELIIRLEELNGKYPLASLSREAQESLNQRFGSTLPGPTPQDFRQIFEAIFSNAMASKYVITPD
jgi:hypothetical protein